MNRAQSHRQPRGLVRHHESQGSTLVAVLVLLVVMSIFLNAVHTHTTGLGRQTAHNGEYLRLNEAADAALEVVIGRLAQWVTANSGYGPSIGDCATAGVPGNSSFPAITSAITFPANSKLADFYVSAPRVYPVLPDDSIVTNTSDPKYLPNLSARSNVSENSSNSATATISPSPQRRMPIASRHGV